MKTKTAILECPFCHKIPELTIKPAQNGTHEYDGCYFYSIECGNDECKIKPKTNIYTDIYYLSKEECIKFAIDDWNRR